ncbi:hypothetical protein [Streptomyces sp. NPDC002580]|uniref:hypothetical protein n=1 Tax=Streptomyces sp. NPDC002580 TaxID=3364653 RepID=UPI0036A7F822
MPPRASAATLLPFTEDNPRFPQFWPLTANEGAGPNARLRMRPWLTYARWSGNIDQAARVADKLVDNAVKHGKPLPGDIVTLRVFGLPETNELAIEAEDALPEFPEFEKVANQSGEPQGVPKGLWWVAHYHGRLTWDVTKDDGGLIIGKRVQAVLPATWDGDV